MATKNCPKCSSQVPVACKKCSCGHTFFTARKGSSASGSGQSSSGGASTSKQDAVVPEPIVLRDRVPRERGRPAFYDAQELDAQMKKQKQLLKQQSKSQSTKSETSKVPSSKASGTENENAATTEEEEAAAHASDGGVEEQVEPKKRKRGRPPGISGKKGRRIPINSASRILPSRKPADTANVVNNNDSSVNNNVVDGKSGTEESEDIMSDLSPEKALQLNIVLNEINRKWASANWKG